MPTAAEVVGHRKPCARHHAALTVENGKGEEVLARLDVCRQCGVALIVMRHGGASGKGGAVPILAGQPLSNVHTAEQGRPDGLFRRGIEQSRRPRASRGKTGRCRCFARTVLPSACFRVTRPADSCGIDNKAVAESFLKLGRTCHHFTVERHSYRSSRGSLRGSGGSCRSCSDGRQAPSSSHRVCGQRCLGLRSVALLLPVVFHLAFDGSVFPDVWIHVRGLPGELVLGLQVGSREMLAKVS